MAGYCGYSMSNNAVYAYESGEKPWSKWTKADMVSACKDFIKCELSEFKKLNVEEMRRLVLYNSSWHHTSNWYNKTEFYSIHEDIEITSETIANIIADRPEKKEVEDDSYKAKCRFLEWSGTRNYPKATEVIEEGTIKGNWFYRNNGRKKSINSNGFRILEKL